MHIDWFVFFAQIVNFLILVYLLKRFLYGRIIGAIDNREARIAALFDEAEQSRKAAAEAAEQYEERNRKLKEAYEDMLARAAQDAEARRKELLDQARADVDLIRQRWQDTVVREKDAFIRELRLRAGREIYAITKRILSDLADVDLESKIADVFMRHIRELNEGEWKAIKDTLSGSGNGIIIQSAFGIPQDVRKKIDETLASRIGNGLKVQYETSDDIVSGIELRTHGHKIAWSLSDYLESLNESFSHALQEEARAKG